MYYLFDTSAVNHLLDDEYSDAICTGVIATNTVRVSSLNVIEAASTTGCVRRDALLRLLSRLTKGARPLEFPNSLVIALCKAREELVDRLNISIGSDNEDLWLILNKPELLDTNPDFRHKCDSYRKSMERDFRSLHHNARPHYQTLFKQGESERPLSAGAFMRRCCSNQEFIAIAVGDFFHHATGKFLPDEEIPKFITAVPELACFLLAYAHSAFTRGMQDKDYGASKNVGFIDLWFAAYLPLCDCLVTADAAQYRTLRLINVFNPQPTQVLTYNEFRRRMLIGVD